MYQTFREKLTHILLKLFQKLVERRTLPNSFWKAIITLIPRPDKDITHTQKLQVSVRDTVTKILNKILANRI